MKNIDNQLSSKGSETSDPLAPLCEKHGVYKKRKYAYGKPSGWVCNKCHAEFCRGKYKLNPEIFKLWVKNNLERRREIAREWERNHPENGDRRRKRKLNAKGSHNLKQRIEKYCLWGQSCAYCKKELDFKEVHWDHVIPLVRGGTNFIANLRPSCKFCNTSKGSKLLSEWN